MGEGERAFRADEEGAASGESFAAGEVAPAVTGSAAAVVPGDGQDLFGEVGAGELVLDDVLGGPDLVVHAGVVGALDFSGSTVDAEGGEDRVEDVAAEVPKGPAAVLPVPQPQGDRPGPQRGGARAT